MTSIFKILPGVKENIPLFLYTTFRIGGPAKYFFSAKNKENLIKAIETAKQLELPFFVLGGGSNVLFLDKGYNGLVVKVESSELEFKAKKQSVEVYCESGVSLSLLVSKSAENGLTGLEWAVGIPGTIGGAIRGNAGAFGVSIGDMVKKVEAVDIKSREITVFDREESCFSYRSSLFKENRNLVVLSVWLKLKKENREKIEERIKKYLDYRKESQPLKFFSAGSIFKNPSKFSAGELIEKCGLKGIKIGRARISEKHANFIINLGGAKAEDVIKLIEIVKQEVKNKFKIQLEEEIEIVR